MAQGIYRFVINNYLFMDKEDINKYKLECKIRAMKQFMEEHNILLADYIKFTETTEEDIKTCTAFYYVDINSDDRVSNIFENDEFKFEEEPMVTFDMCNGNIGATTFMMDAYKVNETDAEYAFRRMNYYKITGDKLYMVWNDCCNRDTEKALKVMKNCKIDFIITKLNYDKGRGINITEEEIEVNKC